MTPTERLRHMHVESIKHRIDQHEYVVDPHAVAEALLRGGRLPLLAAPAAAAGPRVSRRGARIRPSSPDAPRR